MKALLLVAMVLAAGCTAFVEPLCVSEACPGGSVCHPDGYCLARCRSDDDCREGFHCSWGDCDPVCNEADCDGYGCDPEYQECFDRCDDDFDCADGYFCCTFERDGEGSCDSRGRHECMRE